MTWHLADKRQTVQSWPYADVSPGSEQRCRLLRNRTKKLKLALTAFQLVRSSSRGSLFPFMISSWELLASGFPVPASLGVSLFPRMNLFPSLNFIERPHNPAENVRCFRPTAAGSCLCKPSQCERSVSGTVCGWWVTPQVRASKRCPKCVNSTASRNTFSV